MKQWILLWLGGQYVRGCDSSVLRGNLMIKAQLTAGPRTGNWHKAESLDSASQNLALGVSSGEWEGWPLVRQRVQGRPAVVSPWAWSHQQVAHSSFGAICLQGVYCCRVWRHWHSGLLEAHTSPAGWLILAWSELGRLQRAGEPAQLTQSLWVCKGRSHGSEDIDFRNLPHSGSAAAAQHTQKIEALTSAHTLVTSTSGQSSRAREIHTHTHTWTSSISSIHLVAFFFTVLHYLKPLMHFFLFGQSPPPFAFWVSPLFIFVPVHASGDILILFYSFFFLDFPHVNLIWGALSVWGIVIFVGGWLLVF